MKTASTWLQNIVFKGNPRLHYFGRSAHDYPRWMIEWQYLDDYAFSHHKSALRKNLLSMAHQGKPNVISSETFTRQGGVIFNQAHRIHEVLPETRIIMVLRDPVDYIESLYKHMVRTEGFFLDLSQYLDWNRTPLVSYKRKPIYLPDLFYDETIDTYQQLFGQDNVCILRYEDLVNKRTSFFETLGVFLGVVFGDDILDLVKIEVNKSMSTKEMLAKRAENLNFFLQQNIPASANKIELTEIEKQLAGQPALVDVELRNQLCSYFSGKCYGYY